jgi:hypothetical protein
MDGHRFDRLTRDLATGSTRRQFLKRAIAGVSGGALAILGLEGASADGICVEYLGRCKSDSECCTGKCSGKSGTPSLKRRCVCPDGRQPCGPDGSCCPEGTDCINGICDFPLCTSSVDCEDGDLCTVNICDPAAGCTTTPVACPVCQVCSGGDCVPDPTQDGTLCANPDQTDFDGFCSNGVCVVDSCPDECPPCQLCLNGSCLPDPNTEGLACTIAGIPGICMAGNCEPQPCPDGCPDCQQCFDGSCIPDANWNGYPCGTGNSAGICDNGVCINQCGAGCPICQTCVGGQCAANSTQDGVSCSTEFPNFICANGICVSPLNGSICTGSAHFSTYECRCVCPPGALCPDGSLPDPENGCQCP